MKDEKLYFDVLTARTKWKLDFMVQDFMHDKLIYRTEYFFDGLFYNCMLIYMEL